MYIHSNNNNNIVYIESNKTWGKNIFFIKNIKEKLKVQFFFTVMM